MLDDGHLNPILPCLILQTTRTHSRQLIRMPRVRVRTARPGISMLDQSEVSTVVT